MARSTRHKIDYWRIMAAMILGSSLFMIWSAPVWRIQSVDIRGTSPYTRKYLETFLKTHALIGEHILRLNPLLLKQQVLKNPLVRDAQFERELLPTRLTVKVQERKPAHLVYRQQDKHPLIDKHKAWILDHEGVVLPLPSAAAPDQLVQVSVSPALVKQRLPQAQLDLLRQLEILAQQKLLPLEAQLKPEDTSSSEQQAPPPDTGRPAGVYDLSNPQNLMLYLAQPPITVWLGRSEDLLIKLKLIQPTLETAKQETGQIEYIDLRFWKHPVLKAKG
ncbi:MAG: cell division protein FtsQ/DivIB [Candidatus Sericytochromatia bacterium]